MIGAKADRVGATAGGILVAAGLADSGFAEVGFAATGALVGVGSAIISSVFATAAGT
ncbi:MAG: hypothetical protein ACR2MW_05780 [Chthoniobacterales bacterium]